MIEGHRVILCVAFILVFFQPEISISSEGYKNKLNKNIIDYTRGIYAQLAEEVMDLNRVKVRIGPILNVCGLDEHRKKFGLSKKEVAEYITKRIFEIRSGDDEKAIFLKKRSEEEISIILSGTLTHIVMYQVGFEDSITFNFDSGVIDKKEYCEKISKTLNFL